MKRRFNTKLNSLSASLAVVCTFILASGCGSNESNSTAPASADSSSPAKTADDIVPPTNPDGYSGAIGNVIKFGDHEVEINADGKPLTIKLTDSLRIYAPTPSNLARVKSSGYVGVISKKQSSGTDQAAQVLILPEELRGLNQGSFMLPPDKDAESGGRMTNGSASDVGGGGGSRMSNGSVSDADTSSITLNFAGHSRTIHVPSGTPVVEYKPTETKPAAGAKIFLLVRKGASDSFVSSKIICF
jgi:hypothetical protein